MRRIAMVLLALCLTGCQAKGPALLTSGSEALVVPHEGSTTGHFGIATDLGLIPAGTKVRISNDPGPAPQSGRKVSVICLDGPYRDGLTTVSAFNLKPL